MMRILSFLTLAVAAAVRADDAKPAAAELAKMARPALVAIQPAGRDGEPSGLGTGFVIAADGLIATNMHVIGEARALQVEMPDGKRLEVTGIHAWSRELDLAVIRVQATGLPALELAGDAALAQGDYVAAMGNPLGLRFSVVEGVVSALQEIEGHRYIQLAMPVEPGNSGGPLLDRNGKVAGIVSMKSALTDNVGFAVPVAELRALLEHPAPVAMKNWLTIGALNGKLWQPKGATWTQRAGVIRARGRNDAAFGGRALCLHQPEPPALPCDFSVSVKLDDESGAAGLAFCADGADTHYGFYPSNGALRLTRFEGPDVNSWTILAQTASPAWQPGEWNHLRVRLTADDIQCFVNGEPVITSKDTALRTGRAGLCKFRHTEPDFRGFRMAKDGGRENPVAAAVAAHIGAEARGESLSREANETLAAYPDTTREIAAREAAVLEKRAAALRRRAAEAHGLSVALRLKEILSAKAPGDSDLARAAFLLSHLDNPDFDPAQGMEEVDRMAEDLRAALSADDKSTPEKMLRALHRWLFQENGFHGGHEDMNHRANSYLNEVIADREGLPITLCVLHRELARRLGLKVSLCSFPARVLNHLQLPGDPPRVVYVDAFERGKILTRAEAAALIAELSGGEPGGDSWQPAGDTEVVLRMLNNLTANAVTAREDERILRYLDTALAVAPDAAPQRLQRMLIHAKNGRRPAARADAEWLLEHQPPGIDAGRVQELLESLR